MDSDDHRETNILDLPNEIFLYIFSSLDSIFILDCLKKVCTRFDSIISDEYVWKNRLNITYPKTTILFNEPECMFNNEDKPWSRVVYDVEMNRKFLQDAKDAGCAQMRTVHLKDVHISSVNQLKLVCDNRLCISVSRDRTIGVWNACQPDQPLVKHIYPAHEGWVWCVDACDDQTFCTGAWDSTFKLWSLEDFTNISTYKCDATVLSLSCQDTLVAAGLFNSKLAMYDTRQAPHDPPQVSAALGGKTGVIQGVTLQHPLVYIAGVNSSLNCFDLRKNKVLATMRPSCRKIMSYSYREGTIVIGDTRSTLTILDRNFKVLSQSVLQLPGAMEKLNCLKQNEFDVFVGTKGALRSYLKAAPVAPIESIPDSKYEMTAIDYDFNNVLFYSSDVQGRIVMHKRIDTAADCL